MAALLPGRSHRSASTEEALRLTLTAPAPPLDDLKDALGKNKKAKATFDGFSPSHKREYVEWLTEAKTESTRKRRLEQAVEWMAEGKSRHWKYVRK